MMETKSFVFNFGDVEVREREFSLKKAGEVLALEPKAFQVLLYLLHNPQRLVSKEELLNAVWGDAVVTDNSLTRIIALLRRVLDDDFREPRYIATVSRVGYRFLCAVEVSEEGLEAALAQAPRADVSDATAADPQKEAETPRVRRWWAYGAGAVALCASGLAMYLYRPAPPFRVTEYTQITHDGHHKAIFGTDGVRLFFDRYPGAEPLAEMPISGGDISTIPLGLPELWIHDISPDGSSFLLRSNDGEHGTLWSAGIMGSPLRRLAEGDIEGAGWSPDGQSAVYSTENGDIHTVRSDGSGDRKLGTVPATTGSELFEQDTWSPDGRTIRFDRNNKIFEIGSDGAGLHEFLPSWKPSSWRCCGHWTRDGKFYLFVAWDATPGTYPLHPPAQIWALDERRGLLNRRATEPFQLTSGPIRWARPIPSKDGTKIFARGVIPNGELERLDPQSHQFQPYLHGISAESVSFSPDGKSVVYVSFPEGILWRANRDGSNPVQLTDPPLYPTFPRWSPDGVHILFSDTTSTWNNKTYILSSQGGVPRPILPGDGEVERDGVWSPDGREIAFSATETRDGKVRFMIRVLDMASQQATKIVGSEDRYSPRWSPDGKYLVALNIKDGSISIFEFETQEWTTLFEESHNDLPNWSRDGKFVYFVRAVDDRGVFRIRLSDRKVEKVVDLKGFRFISALGPWMGLDPDDTPLLMRDTGGDDIYALTLERK